MIFFLFGMEVVVLASVEKKSASDFSYLSNSITASLAIYLNWRTQKLQEITSDVRASGFWASGGLDLSIF